MPKTTSPVAGRLRRPGWTDPRLLIGVVLIAIAVTLTVSAISRADVTEPYYAARATVVPGQRITLDDLVVVNVKVSSDEYVAAGADVSEVVAARVIESGELVPASALMEADRFEGRPVAVESSRPLSEDVRPGAVVDVWVTREGEDGTPQSELVGRGLTVASVGTDGGAFAASSSDVVYVVVDADEVGSFLAAMSGDGDVAVVAGVAS